MPRKVIRASDLPPPHQVSDEDFDEICRTSKIPNNHRSALRDWLDNTSTAFQQVITEARKLRSRRADREAIVDAIEDLRRAEYRLRQQTGIAGRQGFRAVGRRIAPAISASWMRHRFPNDPATPSPIYWPCDDRTSRQSSRVPSRPVDMEDLSLDERIEFMEQRGGKVVPMLLRDIIAALEDGRRAIVQLPDGRKPLKNRAYMLAALAEAWHRLGRRPTSGINSRFGCFCEAVFEAIGWPTEGVNAALADTKKLWRTLYHPY